MESGTSDTRQKIVDAAVTLIEQGGEQVVRLRTIADIVGISYPTCYHYFKNRDALIVVAQSTRLRKNLDTTINPFLEAVQSCTSKKQFVEILLGVYHHSFQPERQHVREVRAEILGAAIQRPDLRREVIQELQLAMEAPTNALRLAKERGWIPVEIDVRSFAIFNLSIISSLVYPELLNDDLMLENYKHISTSAITALLMNEDS